MPNSAPVPPDFIMEAYADELAPDAFVSMQLLFQLRRCVQRVNADLFEWLGASALSPGRMQMLMILWARKTPVLQRDLVQWLKLSRASVSELIETLRRDGLVETRPDEHHGRRMFVTLTTAGAKTAAAMIHANAQRLTQSFETVSTQDKERLIAMLARLCGSAESAG